MKLYLSLAASLLSVGAHAQTCASRLLVSGYFSNNVYLHDGCSGAFQRTLDTQGRIVGAQATGIGPDGKLYVVSEGSAQILRYNPQTLDFEKIAVTLPLSFGATGMVFSGNNEIWVAGYEYDGVKKYNLATGAFIADAVPPRAAGLNGPDNGMVFGPDGKLYIPGYDSNNVVRFDPASNSTSVFIPAGSGGLAAARGILFEPGGQTVLVSGELSGTVARYNASTGAFIRVVVSGLFRPTGLAWHPDGSLLVTTFSSVGKHDPETGALRGTAALASASGADGLTYVSVLSAPAAVVDASQIGSQYWVSGTGTINARTLQVNEVISTTGAAFGSAFKPGEVVIKSWGSLRIVFTSCTEGMFSWDSTSSTSAGFGSGSYPLQRLIPNEATQRCQQAGFANANDLEWINGSWYGGPTRSGEGLLIDKTTDGRAFVAWFTYRPR